MEGKSPEQSRHIILKKIYERLSNPDVKKDLYDSIKKIEEIYGYKIDISLVIEDDDPMDMSPLTDDEYVLNQDYKDLLNASHEDTMTMNEFIKFLSEEEGDMKVSIDPLYLKKGRNDIRNVLLTTFEDKVIIVPKPVEEKNDTENSGN